MGEPELADEDYRDGVLSTRQGDAQGQELQLSVEVDFREPARVPAPSVERQPEGIETPQNESSTG